MEENIEIIKENKRAIEKSIETIKEDKKTMEKSVEIIKEDTITMEENAKIVKIEDVKEVEHLFGDWENNFLDSCLKGIMGEIYSYNHENPKSAIAIMGDFKLLAGEIDEELLKFNPCGDKKSGFEIIVPQNEAWANLVRNTFSDNIKEITRYATFEDITQFDSEKLNEIKNSISKELEILDIDEKIYNRCLEEEWSKDLVGNYKDYRDFSEKALGVVLLDKEKNEILSGASSYSTFSDGIEIEIDTNEQHRRKGYAYICGACMILKCLEKGIYPSWDAHNEESIKLAEKLGYKRKFEYTAFELYRS